MKLEHSENELARSQKEKNLAVAMIVENMLKDGMSVEKISSLTGYPYEKITHIKKKFDEK